MTDQRQDKPDKAAGANLDAVFAMAREQVPQPPDALMQAIVKDALSVQPPAGNVVALSPRRGVFAEIWATMGGLAGAAALAACLVVGFGLGFVAPAPSTDDAVSVIVDGADLLDDIQLDMQLGG
ncbi:MAG: hypothetical protein Q9M41_04925 [Paracoccaceae bacterium]|nr:hypothetical protein [Paracoccaceae bacterium]